MKNIKKAFGAVFFWGMGVWLRRPILMGTKTLASAVRRYNAAR